MLGFLSSALLSPQVKFAKELKQLRGKLADLAKIENSRQLQTLDTLKKLREKPELEELVKNIEASALHIQFSREDGDLRELWACESATGVLTHGLVCRTRTAAGSRTRKCSRRR